jgi:hypothetical protein
MSESGSVKDAEWPVYKVPNPRPMSRDHFFVALLLPQLFFELCGREEVSGHSLL